MNRATTADKRLARIENEFYQTWVGKGKMNMLKHVTAKLGNMKKHQEFIVYPGKDRLILTKREEKKMKTKKQVLSERSDYSKLINAVISRIGMESVEDVVNHGIDGGFSGFIYTADTVKFWKTYKKDIMKMAQEMAADWGESLLEMIGALVALNTTITRERNGRIRKGKKQ